MYNMYGQQTHITIRPAGPEHGEALRILAQRDSAPVPPGQLLLALAGKEPKAAISLTTGAVIADPFQPTEALVGLLQERARQLRTSSGFRARLAARRARRLPRRALSPQPAGTLRAFD
jgi:hypothetical protein